MQDRLRELRQARAIRLAHGPALDDLRAAILAFAGSVAEGRGGIADLPFGDPLFPRAHAGAMAGLGAPAASRATSAILDRAGWGSGGSLAILPVTGAAHWLAMMLADPDWRSDVEALMDRLDPAAGAARNLVLPACLDLPRVACLAPWAVRAALEAMLAAFAALPPYEALAAAAGAARASLGADAEGGIEGYQMRAPPDPTHAVPSGTWGILSIRLLAGVAVPSAPPDPPDAAALRAAFVDLHGTIPVVLEPPQALAAGGTVLAARHFQGALARRFRWRKARKPSLLVRPDGLTIGIWSQFPEPGYVDGGAFGPVGLPPWLVLRDPAAFAALLAEDAEEVVLDIPGGVPPP